MTKHLQIKVTGRVHGIGFRFSAYEKMVELGLLGKAENVPGGLVINVEGSEDKLLIFTEWCKQGPTGAVVENLELAELNEPFVPLKTS